MKEIVGAKINDTITNDRQIISAAVKADWAVLWLNRKEMQFMAVFDLGERWETLAKGPTLFLLDEKGKPHETKNKR